MKIIKVFWFWGNCPGEVRESHSLLWEIGCSTWCKGVPEGCPADLVSVLKRITIRATIVDNLPVWATKSIWLSCSWIDQLLLFFLNWLIILELTYSSSIDLLLFLNWLILVLKSTFYRHSLINFIFILIDSLFLNWLQLCVILELASLFFLNVFVILIDFSCSWINFLANEWAIWITVLTYEHEDISFAPCLSIGQNISCDL